MTWYAAHIVMQVELYSEEQIKFPIWENIYLVEANTVDEAISKAEKIGLSHNGDSNGSFRWGDKPAHWVFRGVRKLIELQSSADIENRPLDGCELTYNSLEFDDRESLIKFVNGESSMATIVD
jgi:hypothetical protein